MSKEWQAADDRRLPLGHLPSKGCSQCSVGGFSEAPWSRRKVRPATPLRRERTPLLIAAIVILVCACLAGALLWSLAVHALPLWCGGAAALWVHVSGAGLLISLMAGLAAATSALAIGQLLIGHARSPLLRACVGVAFALPAAIAGYHAAHGIVAAFGETGLAGIILSLLVAAMTGIAALCGALRPRGEPRPAVPGGV